MLDVSNPAVATNGSSPAAEPDPRETDEWIEALDGVISAEGPQRAREIIEALTVRARTRGADIPITLTTPYINTIPVHAQPRIPAITTSKKSCGTTRAGTRWRWSCARTSTSRAWAATSRRSNRRRR
jgi:pyruvate dehydrogenase complex dehydrogenase (E1) component